MPPARSRVVVDDARSDISNTNPRDRVVSTTAAFKGKKASTNALNGSVPSTKLPVSSAVPSAVPVGSTAVDPEQDHPHV